MEKLRVLRSIVIGLVLVGVMGLSALAYAVPEPGIAAIGQGLQSGSKILSAEAQAAQNRANALRTGLQAGPQAGGQSVTIEQPAMPPAQTGAQPPVVVNVNNYDAASNAPAGVASGGAVGVGAADNPYMLLLTGTLAGFIVGIPLFIVLGLQKRRRDSRPQFSLGPTPEQHYLAKQTQQWQTLQAYLNNQPPMQQMPPPTVAPSQGYWWTNPHTGVQEWVVPGQFRLPGGQG